ncbi:hypothetical protein MP228_006765 [Amoeboaphelidium protococcarum]|nr:hypothetical protein MP228_006765 [Amoeboaphelidium protococcarum]
MMTTSQQSQVLPSKKKLKFDDKLQVDDQWRVNTNEMVELRLKSRHARETAVCHPKFTYVFYGFDEEIIGYKDLKLRLTFSYISFRPLVEIEYSSRMTPMPESTQTDPVQDIVVPLLREMLQLNDGASTSPLAVEGREWTCDRALFEHQWLQDDEDSWTLYGEYDGEFQVGGTTFNVYKASFGQSDGFDSWYRRVQIFMLFYIEGATYIDEEDDKWDIYLIYKQQKDGHSKIQLLAGVWTCYKFYSFPDKIRQRISQALILPFYQGQGVGYAMYKYLYKRFLEDDHAKDITVEDPTEAFSDLRTICDLNTLKNALGNTSLDSRYVIPSPAEIEELRIKLKFSPQHMQVLMEIHLLRHLLQYQSVDDILQNSSQFRTWVKKRIYSKNAEALAEIDDEEERKDAVQETYENVIEDYQRILNKLPLK